jgi:hypothetical protein
MDMLTKPYNNFEILRIAARIAFRVGRRTQDRTFICSELVDECCRAVAAPPSGREQRLVCVKVNTTALSAGNGQDSTRPSFVM